MGYAELSCQSAFSFLRGASEPETLVERARRLGYAALAVTDRDGLYGAPRFHAAARSAGLPAVHGVTLSLRRHPDRPDDRVVLLAQDGTGWRSLCRLVSAARHRSRTLPVTPIEGLLAESAGLLALAGPDLPETDVAALAEGFGRSRSFLMIHDRLLKRDRRGQLTQGERGARYQLPLVVTGGVRFARRSDKPAHDVLTCVRHKTTLQRAGPLLLPNAEFCLRPVAEIEALFREIPEAVARSVEIASRCAFSLESLAYRFPPFEVPAGETAISHLRRLVQEGARERYGSPSAAVARQLAYELDLIGRLDMAGYFLVVHDIVRFCRERRILCQGRGSAANSAVCYALGITSVDPVGMGLLFERFLSETRGEMPDIDLDIAHQDREQVLQYVYRRYGRERAALAAEVISYRTRSAVRDAGKALGFSLQEVERLAKGLERRWDGDSGELPDDPRLGQLKAVAGALLGLPRHLSIHVGGMIITGPPLTEVMPVEPAAMKDRTVVPWDKDDLQTLGILKIDLLGLGMLTVLDRCLSSTGLELHTVPPDDRATWDMLCAADTVGVFQVESRAQMNCLPRLKPRRFYDLVVEVALIRPGPIQGHMVHPYLRRRARREPITYLHPSLKPILERTLGIPLFQEQGMKIAVAAAGFTPGEADELRRAMGHKRSHARMQQLSVRLIGGLMKNGIARPMAERIHAQLAAFADYGFPESHAASFARLVWVSAWLKRHAPSHFLCALLNAQPMGFYPPAVLVSDARRHGVVVLPVDVLKSDWDCTLEETSAPEPATRTTGVRNTAGAGGALACSSERIDERYAVRLGLCTVRGLGERQREGVRAARESLQTRGPFTDPGDFARRSGLSLQAMENLARLGALAGFQERRRQALWQVAQMARAVPGPLAEPLPAEGHVELPALDAAQELAEDFRMGGLSVSCHPLELLRPQLEALGVSPAAALRGAKNDVQVAGMVICRQRPPTAGGLTFVTIEDESGFANLIVTPEVAQRDRAGLFAGLLLATGRLQAAEGVINVRVTSLQPLARGRIVPSHDYR